MTVSISNMAQVWMSNTNTYNGIAMSISTLGYGANQNSRVVNYKVDGNSVSSIDANGIFYVRPNTVANLPLATATFGGRTIVTDSNTTTFYARVYGGGSNCVPVFSNGTYWLIG